MIGVSDRRVAVLLYCSGWDGDVVSAREDLDVGGLRLLFSFLGSSFFDTLMFCLGICSLLFLIMGIIVGLKLIIYNLNLGVKA